MARLRPSRILFVLLVATAVLLLAGQAAVRVRDADISDFRCFYEAGRLVAHDGDPYDRTTWAAATITRPDRVPHCAKTFIYPLWTAAVMAPLTVLDEPVALASWEGILLGCTFTAVALIARTWSMFGGARLLLVTLLWSQPMFSAVGNAQFGPVILLLVAALAHALGSGRARVAAIAWWLLLLKPHIAALAMAGTLAAASRRSQVTLVAGTGVIAAASLALIPSWPLDLLRENFDQQQLLGDPGLGTLWSLAADLGLPTLVGGAVAVALCIACLVLVSPRQLRPSELVAALVAASFLVTPYARPHDLVVLACAWAVPLAWAKEAQARERQRIVYATIAIALALPWAITALSLLGAPLSLYVLVSLATAGLTVVAIRARAPLSPAQPLG